MPQPIEVEGPDGTIIEFPEGTSTETIRQVMRRQFPAPPAGGQAQPPPPQRPVTPQPQPQGMAPQAPPQAPMGAPSGPGVVGPAGYTMEQLLGTGMPLAEAEIMFNGGTPDTYNGNQISYTDDRNQTAETMPSGPAGITSPTGRRPITGGIMDPIMGGSREQPIDVENLTAEQINALGEGFQGAFIRQPDGSIARVRDVGTPAGDIGGPNQVGQSGIQYFDAKEGAERMGAFAQALTEQVPFGMDYVAGVTGAITGEGYSNTRDLLDEAAAEQRMFNPGLRNAGGLTGFGASMGLPGVGAADRWVRGAQGAERLRRAALSGALFGGVYGAGTGRGGIDERITRGVEGAGIGAATGGALEGLLGRAGRQAQSQPTPQRELSRQGVELTPGQMLEPVPILGPMARGAEDLMTGIPFVGPIVQGARDRGVESLNRVPLARALEAIGETLPRRVRAGYDAVEYTQGRFREAYDDVLSRASAQLDPEFQGGIADILTRAADELPAEHSERLANLLARRVVGQADDTGHLSGEVLKNVETDLRQLADRWNRSDDVYAQGLADYLMETRDVVRGAIARTTPEEAARLQAINRGYGALATAERAAGTSAAQGRGGVFTPGELSVAVGRGRSRSALASGSAPMQDLSAAARQVMPSRVGDSGTAGRATITAIGAGASMGMGVAPQIAVPVIVGAAAYSKPAQMLLNAIYRATDPTQAAQALEGLGRMAQRTPALQSYYQDAARHLQSLTSGDTAAAQGQPQPQSARLAQ